MKITNNARTYTNFNNSFGFKINKLSKELKRYSAKMIGEFKDLGIPELFTLNVIGDAHKDVTIKYITTVHWADQGTIQSEKNEGKGTEKSCQKKEKRTCNYYLYLRHNRKSQRSDAQVLQLFIFHY